MLISAEMFNVFLCHLIMIEMVEICGLYN